MVKFKLTLVLLLFFSLGNSSAQSDTTTATILTETISSDSISQKKSIVEKKKGTFIKRFLKEDYPSPRKAVILTAVLPGLGQVYNKKHWYIKLPLIYGAFGGLIYGIDFNTKQYKILKKEYEYMVDKDPTTISIFENNPNVSSALVKSERDKYDKWKQLCYIGIGLAYIVTAAEAYTTAHLLSFDVSDDLSLQFKPSFDFIPEHGMTMGVGVQFHLHQNKSPQPQVVFQK